MMQFFSPQGAWFCAVVHLSLGPGSLFPSVVLGGGFSLGSALIPAWFSGYQRDRLDANTIQGQGRYFDNKSSQPAAVADKR